MARLALVFVAFAALWGNANKFWVFFTDKGAWEGADAAVVAERRLSQRSLERRRRLGIPLDWYDLPVDDAYVAALELIGAEVLRTSRWLNAVSVRCDPSLLPAIEGLSFVRGVSPVGVCRIPAPRVLPALPRGKSDYYGLSARQIELLGADLMHQRGWRGEGVLVGMLDSGFELACPAFDSLLASGRLVAKFDFVHGDTSLGNDTAAGDWDPGGFSHGTMTLSCIGALIPGELVGIAPHACFALAKTEIVDSITATDTIPFERRIEEDNWVAGLEWLDSVGVDIVTSSLGYFYFDLDGWGYSFAQLDGDFAVVTVAADVAASRGIAVFNSTGNERAPFGWWDHILAPADGDSVCAVGAVDGEGVLAPFSSPGPTADGRTKPDLVAMGVDVAVWSAADGGVVYVSGTSFSAPLVAGMAALVLQAARDQGTELGGWALVERLKRAADQADRPDNDYGWGIPKAPVAANIFDAVFGIVQDATSGTPVLEASVALDGDTIPLDGRGRFCALIDRADGVHSLYVDAPGYIPHAQEIEHRAGQIHRLTIELSPTPQLAEGVLCYPNPCRGRLWITWYRGASGLRTARIAVFSASGELVATLEPEEGEALAVWDGKNLEGEDVADGVYVLYIRLTDESSGEEEVKRERILLVR